MKQNKFLKQISFIAIIGTLLFLTGCTTTKHILKRTEKVKVYKSSEVLKSYKLDKKKDEFTPLVTFDSDYLMGFSFDEQQKDKIKNSYPPVVIREGEKPLYIKEINVNIDLCKHWKKTSFRETLLEEKAYGKNYSTFNPTPYKLFMSLEKLKKKGLVPNNSNEQEDICIYIDSKIRGHFRTFNDKSNKIRYEASEINHARVELERK